MANAWEELENRCYEYLRRMYGDNNSIEPYGKSDSTKADIRITSPTYSIVLYVQPILNSFIFSTSILL